MLLGILLRKHIKTLPDTELLVLIRNGNKQASGEIFNRYSGLVYGVCLKYFGSDQMKAEDMMMFIFEKLNEKIKKHTIENFRSWLHSVVRNECLMDLRKTKVYSNNDEDQLSKIKTEDDEDTILLANIKEKQLIALESGISQLKDEQKKCLELFYIKDLSYEQVVSETGFDLKKVKSYIQNGKRNLKLILEQQDAFKK